MEHINDDLASTRGIDEGRANSAEISLHEENLKLKRQLKASMQYGAMMTRRSIAAEERAVSAEEQLVLVNKKTRDAQEEKDTAVELASFQQWLANKATDRALYEQMQAHKAWMAERCAYNDFLAAQRNVNLLEDVVQKQRSIIAKIHRYKDLLQSPPSQDHPNPSQGVMQPAEELAQPSSKRPAPSSSESDRPEKKAKSSPAPTRKLIPCSKCYVHGWECDDGEPCFNCGMRGLTTKCKRVMCLNFPKGACKNSQCTFVHQDDGYEHMMVHIKLLRETSGRQEPAKEIDDVEISDDEE